MKINVWTFFVENLMTNKNGLIHFYGISNTRAFKIKKP